MNMFDKKDKRSNLSVDVFGKKFNDVLTTIGDAIDSATGNESGTGHKVGSFLDSLTEDLEIKIGKKDK